MKKLLSLLMALIFVLSISGCGEKKESFSETPVTENEEISEEKAPVIGEENTSDKKEEVKEPVKEEAKKEETAPAPEKAPEKEPEPIPEEKPDEKPAKKTAGNTLLDAFKAEASSKSASELAKSLSKNPILPFAMDALEVEEGYLAGFDSEIHGFKEGASFFPIMSAIPFVGYVFTLESEGEVSSFINTLKSNANLRWNVCSEAEEMVYGSVGNKVFFVMTNKDLTK